VTLADRGDNDGNDRDHPGDEQVLFVVPQVERPLWDAAEDADYIEGRVHDDRRHLLTAIAGVHCQAARGYLHRIAEWVSAFGAMMEW
jgi:hypothetical protein